MTGSGTTPIWKRVWIRIAGSRPPRYRRGWMDVSGAAMGRRALAAAKRDVGLVERPAGSNRQKFGVHWGENGVPWCGLAVAYWWQKGGFIISRELAHAIDYVPTLVSFAQRKQHGLSLIHPRRVRRGDAVGYDFDGGVADHVGLFDEWVSYSAGTFYAIEGNTSIGNDSNGGEVMRRMRHVSQVAAFVRKLPG